MDSNVFFLMQDTIHEATLIHNLWGHINVADFASCMSLVLEDCLIHQENAPCKKEKQLYCCNMTVLVL